MANTKLYLIIQLKRSGFRKDHLHRAYLSLVRPLLEYAVAVWHPGLPLDLSSDLERIQKRALKIIAPELSYDQCLADLKIDPLSERRENTCSRLFHDMQSPDHKIHKLLLTQEIPPTVYRNTASLSLNHLDQAHVKKNL